MDKVNNLIFTSNILITYRFNFYIDNIYKFLCLKNLNSKKLSFFKKDVCYLKLLFSYNFEESYKYRYYQIISINSKEISNSFILISFYSDISNNSTILIIEYYINNKFKDKEKILKKYKNQILIYLNNINRFLSYQNFYSKYCESILVTRSINCVLHILKNINMFSNNYFLIINYKYLYDKLIIYFIRQNNENKIIKEKFILILYPISSISTFIVFKEKSLDNISNIPGRKFFLNYFLKRFKETVEKELLTD